VKNKQTELHNIISSCTPDIIIGTETHTDPTFNNAEILPANVPAEHIYQTFRKDRKELIEKGGGGVLIMVRPELAAEECLDLDTDCEIKWVKVAVSKSENILIGSYYREPKSKLEALEELDKSLSKIANSNVYKNMKLFIGGDFNLGDIDWSLGRCVAGARDKNHCETYFQSDPYTESVEHNWTNFKETLMKSLNTNIPTKTLKGNRNDLPWMSKKIKNMIHKNRNFTIKPEAHRVKKISLPSITFVKRSGMDFILHTIRTLTT